MTFWIRSALQLLILSLGGFLFWRYRDLPWSSLMLLTALFSGLLLFASVLGTRYTETDYVLPPSFTENTALLIAGAGLSLPLVTWSLWPLLLLLAWWALLIAYLIHPAGSDFNPAKQYFRRLRAQALTPPVLARRGAFVVTFWPLFIPKAVWFWGLLLFGGAWVLGDFLFSGD
jgi:hypothetical protein